MAVHHATTIFRTVREQKQNRRPLRKPGFSAMSAMHAADIQPQKEHRPSLPYHGRRTAFENWTRDETPSRWNLKGEASASFCGLARHNSQLPPLEVPPCMSLQQYLETTEYVKGD